MTNILKNVSYPIFVGFIVLTILLALSYSLRMRDFKSVVGARNLEATYHVLLTVTALNENPVKNHWYLPAVSLGKVTDKYIPWGATVPTETGDYVYTSFTPPGFLAPYFWFKFLKLEPSVSNLANFNFVLGSLTTFALYYLLVNLLKFNGYCAWTSVGGALVGSTIGAFSREAMQSNGIIYWSQCLYQLVLILSLIIIFRWLTSENKGNRHAYSVALIVMVFLGALTEWTGYVFNVGLVFLLYLNTRNLPSSRALAKHIMIATIIAGVLTVLHYGLAVGFLPAIKAFLLRFLARSGAAGSVVDLIQGYSLSYGLFILTIFAILVQSYFDKRQQTTDKRQQTTNIILIAALIPLLENILMLQHATEFSFDRLKFIFPASLIFAFSFARLETKGRVVLLALVLISCFHGWKSYKKDMEHYLSWANIDAENRSLVSQISDKVGANCVIFSSSIGVRGYSNLLFHRGIYENKSAPETSHRLLNSNACDLVYLEGDYAFPDLPRYTRATITNPDFTVTIFLANAAK